MVAIKRFHETDEDPAVKKVGLREVRMLKVSPQVAPVFIWPAMGSCMKRLCLIPLGRRRVILLTRLCAMALFWPGLHPVGSAAIAAFQPHQLGRGWFACMRAMYTCCCALAGSARCSDVLPCPHVMLHVHTNSAIKSRGLTYSITHGECRADCDKSPRRRFLLHISVFLVVLAMAMLAACACGWSGI